MSLLDEWKPREKRKRLTPRQKGTNPRAKGTNPRAMSKRSKKAITVGDSDSLCRQCGGKMVVRKHRELTDKIRKQFYYFTQWDYCGRCNKVYFNERYKKTNPKGAQLDEVIRQRSFINSL